MMEERNVYALKEVYDQMKSVISNLASENGMDTLELYDAVAKCLEFEFSFLHLTEAVNLEHQMNVVKSKLIQEGIMEWTSDKKLRCATLR